MALIVVCDDDNMTRSLLKDILEANGHTTLEAENGSGCIAHIGHSKPDLVFLDVFMPDKDGIETITEIREKWPNIKVICMSGGGSDGSMQYLEYTKEFGANHTLLKPFSARKVLKLVQETLG